MNVSELIEHLKTLHPQLTVYVRYQDPTGGSDYWELTADDVVYGAVMDSETEKEYPAIVIGDERV
jgi:hypothetical protein